MPIIIDNDTGREINDNYQPQVKGPTSRREGFQPYEGDGLNAFHLLFLVLLLAGVLAAVPFLLGMAK